ncbi:RNA polymerase sigma-70 factor [Maribellus sediminis]|uniref:RNA polymerase sigma-70 factor n=1 Tax=Maribellus sediminis TaxID=2696285 RepID=UPI001431BE87|nr:RNA polymerase sigma-70 factor [Maribellus sediminis]
MNQRSKNTSEQSFVDSKSYESFKVLFGKYFKSLCFFAMKYLQSMEAAEDVVQDAFRELWEKRSEVRESDKLPIYLYQTVKNKCINLIRKNKSQEKYLEWIQHNQLFVTYEDKAMIEAEIFREIMFHVDALPEKSREVFKLSYLHKKKEQEISELLNVSVNTVKTHKMRAKKALQAKLKHLSLDD